MSVSLNFRQEAFKSETGIFPICLVTISHASLTQDIRLSTDATERLLAYTTEAQVVYGTTSRGNDYFFYPMRLGLPNDTDEGPGEIKIEIDNINSDYISIIRSIFSPPSFKIEMVMSNDLDTVELEWPGFELTNIQYDSAIITGTLKLDIFVNEPFPAHTYTPSYFPGVF